MRRARHAAEGRQEARMNPICFKLTHHMLLVLDAIWNSKSAAENRIFAEQQLCNAFRSTQNKPTMLDLLTFSVACGVFFPAYSFPSPYKCFFLHCVVIRFRGGELLTSKPTQKKACRTP